MPLHAPSNPSPPTSAMSNGISCQMACATTGREGKDLQEARTVGWVVTPANGRASLDELHFLFMFCQALPMAAR